MKKIFIIVIGLILLAIIYGKWKYRVRSAELDHISFNVSSDVMIDSLNIIIPFLNKMDYGNGVSYFFAEGKLCYSKKGTGYNTMEIPNNNSHFIPIIEPFDQATSKRFLNLVSFLRTNGISSVAKNYRGYFSFYYKQEEFNPTNYFKLSRIIRLIQMPYKPITIRNDTTFVVIDEYRSLQLLAPKSRM
jgi:hypothetical protein